MGDPAGRSAIFDQSRKDTHQTSVISARLGTAWLRSAQLGSGRLGAEQCRHHGHLESGPTRQTSQSSVDRASWADWAVQVGIEGPRIQPIRGQDFLTHSLSQTLVMVLMTCSCFLSDGRWGRLEHSWWALTIVWSNDLILGDCLRAVSMLVSTYT